MKNHRFSKKLWSFLCIVLIVAMALCMGACGKKESAVAPEDVVILENGGTYGEGAKEFTLVVVDPEGKEVTATIKTDETMVGIALQNLGMLSGEMNSYGLYVKTVNGITLDYNKDGMYWGFYIDGEYAMTGVDMTEIVPGSTYTLKADK